MNDRLTNLIFALVLLFSASLVAQEKPMEFKAGVVDLQKIFKSYYKTAETQIDIDQERARIQKENNEGLAQLKEIETKLEELTERSRVEGLAEIELIPLLRERQDVSTYYERLQAEREACYGQANNRFDQQMNGKMSGLLKEIHKLVEAHAAEGFTIIFEKSGTNPNQVAPLFYGKGLIDITNPLMVELNKERPDTK
ncbi:MAG: OmpH family outer membrane protein [Akkermansiaceae bacterium]|jgi:Skp family chaperone for outer membrane proteins|nr:OmpH family outer membrane protein [Akkermansiaceae bacterium]